MLGPEPREDRLVVVAGQGRDELPLVGVGRVGPEREHEPEGGGGQGGPHDQKHSADEAVAGTACRGGGRVVMLTHRPRTRANSRLERVYGRAANRTGPAVY